MTSAEAEAIASLQQQSLLRGKGGFLGPVEISLAEDGRSVLIYAGTMVASFELRDGEVFDIEPVERAVEVADTRTAVRIGFENEMLRD